jgi:hypothetical protein
MNFRLSAALLAAAALSVSGCGGIVDPSQNQVETFSGTIAPGGQSQQGAHGFSASKTGEIQIKVTQLTPSTSNTFIGVLWTGRNSNGTCAGSLGQVFGQNNFAQVGLPAISTQILSGGYCVLLYDVGSFTTTENYTVTVSHPQ